MFFCSVVCEIGPKRTSPKEGKVEVEVNDRKRGMSSFNFTYRVGTLFMHLICSTVHVYNIGLNPNSPLSQAGGESSASVEIVIVYGVYYIFNFLAAQKRLSSYTRHMACKAPVQKQHACVLVSIIPGRTSHSQKLHVEPENEFIHLYPVDIQHFSVFFFCCSSFLCMSI